MVKFVGSGEKFNPEPMSEEKPSTANFSSEMSTVYNGQNPATSHENYFNDVSNRNENFTPNVWEN